MFERWNAEGYGLGSQPLPAGPRELPASTKIPMERANPMLSVVISKWLRIHGKTVKPKLTQEQQTNLSLCFRMMDADGSGAVDADELDAAFKLLGLNISKRELEALLAEVDKDGSGEVEYAEFLEIMTSTLTKLAQAKDGQQQQQAAAAASPASSAGSRPGSVTGGAAEDGSAGESKMTVNAAAVLPFDIVATAYRRKKLMEALEEDNKEFILSVAEAEEAERKNAEAEQAAAQRSRPRRSSAHLHNGQRPDQTVLGLVEAIMPAGCAGSQPSLAAGASQPAGLASLSQSPARSHGSFLNSLSKEERRIIEHLSRKYHDLHDEQAGAISMKPQHGSPLRSRATAGAPQPPAPHLAALQRGRAVSPSSRSPQMSAPGAGGAGRSTSPLLQKWGRSRSPSPTNHSSNREEAPMLVHYDLRHSRQGWRQSQQHGEDRQIEEGLQLLAPQFSRTQA